jgi:hypothetical protein
MQPILIRSNAVLGIRVVGTIGTIVSSRKGGQRATAKTEFGVYSNIFLAHVALLIPIE